MSLKILNTLVTPEEFSILAEKEGIGLTERIKILRKKFNLSLMDAKNIDMQAINSKTVLENQEDLKKVLEIILNEDENI